MIVHILWILFILYSIDAMAQSTIRHTLYAVQVIMTASKVDEQVFVFKMQHAFMDETGQKLKQTKIINTLKMITQIKTPCLQCKRRLCAAT